MSRYRTLLARSRRTGGRGVVIDCYRGHPLRTADANRTADIHRAAVVNCHRGSARSERNVDGNVFGPSNGFCTLTLTKTGNGFDGTFILSPPLDKFLHVTGNLVGSAITLRSASGDHNHGDIVRQHLVRRLCLKRDDVFLEREPLAREHGATALGALERREHHLHDVHHPTLGA